MSFPQDFIWGAATAPYQIEGAAYADKKGLSINCPRILPCAVTTQATRFREVHRCFVY